MFPAPEPVPVYVEYDCRGQRVTKHFDDGMSEECRTFFRAKSKAGRNPVLKRADGKPSHVTSEPTHVFVQYDSARTKSKRLIKKFPELNRAAKLFWHEMVRAGRYPKFLAHDLSELFGRNSRYEKPITDEQQEAGTDESQDNLSSRDPQADGCLFDNLPTQLPD